MAKKPWCIATSHPLVDQVAKKYNLTPKDARIVLNTARRDNPELQGDNYSLEFLESQGSFKDALHAYAQKYIDVDKALTKEPYSPVADKEDFKKDLRKAGYRFDDAKVDELLSRRDEMAQSTRISKLSSKDIYDLLRAYPDSRRMQFLGDWLCAAYSDYVTRLDTDPALRKKYGVEKQRDRRHYFTDTNARNAIVHILFGEEDEDGNVIDEGEIGRRIAKLEAKNPNDPRIDELDALSDYLYTFLFMYGSNIFRDEGVRVDLAGNFTLSNSDAASSERNDYDTTDEDDEDESEQVVTTFGVSDQNKSITTKLVPTVKSLLRTMRTGRIDKYGYGLWSYVSVPDAVNKLLKVCEGCDTFAEMLAAMKRNQRSVPWMGQLVSVLEITGNDTISTSKKEQLQTMFYQSFRKQFTLMRHTMQQIDKDGNIVYVGYDSNRNELQRKYINQIRSSYWRKTGLLFDHGELNFNKLNDVRAALGMPATRSAKVSTSSLLNKILGVSGKAKNIAAAAARQRQTQKPSYEDLYAEMREYTKQVKSALTMLGINVSDKILDEYLSNQPASASQSNSFGAAANWGDENLMLAIRRLTTLITSINSLVSELDKWGEFQNDKGIVETNPYRKSVYPNIYRVTGGYEKLVATLLEFHTDANESMAYANGKRYYSWNNPSTIGSIIEKFRRNPDKMRAYIRDKYTQDKLWYLRQGSTEADMQFYSDLLNDLYNGHGDPRQLIEYSEVIGFNGEKYEQMSDMSYAMQMLNDFFTPESTPTGPKNTRAWYRMLIAGDKPRYATVRLRRYAEEDAHYDEEFGKVIYGEKDYHRIFENKALDYLTQEILRSESVIRYAAKHRGPKVNGYDVDRRDARFKHVFDKIANDEPVTIDDVVKDGNYIFKGTGAAFYFNRFINNEIEQDTDLGRYIVDRIFNTHLQKDTRRVIDPILIPAFTDAFHNYMQNILEHNFNSLLEMGMFAEQFRKGDEESGASKHLKYLRGNMMAWNAANPQFRVTMYRENTTGIEAMAERFGVDLSKEPAERTFFAELAYFRYMLENYVYNNWYAKVEMAQVFDVDLAFYGDTTNFQKRNAQVVSSGMTTDPDAKIHGELVSDGKYRSVTIKTHKVPSEYLDNIEAVLNRWRNKIADPVRQAQFWKGAKDTLGKLGKIDPTDGQAFVGLTALRKRLAGQGQWSRSNTKQIDTDGYYVDENGRKIYVYTDEAVYQRMKKAYAGVPDEVRINDFQHVFSQVQKDFVYTFDHMDRAERGKVTVPVQHKNSEYALVFLSAFTALEEPESQLAGISRFLEETAKADIRKGIDTVNFDSAVKIGGTSEAIDLYGLDGQQTYQALMKQVYGSGVDGYRPGFVTTYDNRDYKIVQEKPEHFKRNAQPMGSQLKILAINNISDNTIITLPSGETITGKQLKARYFEALRRKVQGVERDFRREYGIGRPLAWRIHSLSNAIKTAMGTDARYSVEMRRALSITEQNGEDRFVMPLDDPSQQAAIEAMLYSKIRRLYYRQKTNGGIVVQATSWGAEGKKLKSLDAVPDLAIRFYSANPEDIEKHGGILRTKREFAAQNPSLSGAQLDAAYKQYTQTYQQGYAYFEAEVPMPDYVRKIIANRDGTIDRKYYNADGSWNMDAIKEVVPDSAFDAICYRVPTEAKYSIMVARVVRFSKEGSGSTAKYPLEITEFTGSDFDIDTTTIELRPGPAQKSSRSVDNELFDLQLGALRSDPAIQETFKSGDFSDLQEESYYTRLLEDKHLNMSLEELDKLSPKELKALCMQVEDLDLFDPMTDILLHNQNSDAGQMIGIAAVGVTSHAFYSLYNDVNLDDPKRNPLTSPENFLRIVVQEADGKHEGMSFTVVNDRYNKEKPTTRYIGGDVLYDQMYDMDGKLISTEISKYVGASADAAKDPALYRLGFTQNTLPVAIFMHRMGISSDIIRKFMKQPVVKQIMQQYSSPASPGYHSIQKACDATVLYYAGQKGFTAKQASDTYKTIRKSGGLELRYSDLCQNIYKPDSQGFEDILKTIHIFQSLQALQKTARNLDGFVRYNSSKAMKGSTFIDRYVKRAGLQTLKDNLSGDNPIFKLPQDVEINEEFLSEGEPFARLCSMFPYIAYTVLGENELTDSVILEHMHTYSPSFFAAAKQLKIEENAEVLRKLYAGWKNYLLFAGPKRIADFRDDIIAKGYTRIFADYYYATLDELQREHKDIYDKVIAGNSFIESIYPVHAKDGYGDFEVLSTNVANLSGTSMEAYKRDWESLLLYPETRELATGLAIHFLARSAAFSRDTPVHLMPMDIREAIPNFADAFEDADKNLLSQDEVDQFIVTFLRNNINDEELVPHVRFSVDHPYVRYSIAPDAPVGTLRVRAGMIQDFISPAVDENGEKYFRLRTPVIHVLNQSTGQVQIYLAINDHVEPEKTVDKNGKEKIDIAIDAIPTTPLGIPYQMSEYTGNFMADSILLDEGQEAPDPDEAGTEDDPTPVQEPEVSDADVFSEYEVERGFATGSFVEADMLSDEELAPEMLARDTGMLKPNQFLETRTTLRRISKMAGLLDFKATTMQRGYTSGDYLSYFINVTPTRFGVDQHEQAVRLAAIAAALSGAQTTAVKTYTQDIMQADVAEISIPFDKKKVNELRRFAEEVWGDDYQLNTDSNMLQLIGHFSTEEPGDRLRELSAMIRVMQPMREYATGKIEVNYARSTAMYSNIDVNQKLEEIQNEESARTFERENPENAGEPRSDKGREVRLGYLAELAIDAQKGKDIRQQLSDLFGEEHYPLASARTSLASRHFVDAVQTDLSETDILTAITELLLPEQMGRNEMTARHTVENIIINTANWIRGNQAETALTLLQGIGYNTEDAGRIMDAIKKELEEQDLC